MVARAAAVQLRPTIDAECRHQVPSFAHVQCGRHTAPPHQAAIEAAAGFLGGKQKPVALAGSLLRV